MPGRFESLCCEVNPEKGNSTDCSSFNESLKNNHCYENNKKSLTEFQSIGVMPLFGAKSTGDFGGTGGGVRGVFFFFC